MQAKAGLPDAAFDTYRELLALGLRPSAQTFAILVAACGRGRQAQRAAEVMARDMPQVRALALLLLGAGR